MNSIKHLKVAAIVTLMAATMAAPVYAGSCGGSDHSHAKAEQAIVPLAEEAGFATLVAAVKAAGLEEALDGEGPFTVFAPTEEAFAKLPEGTIESLLANPEALKQVLLYHVVSGDVRAEDVVKLKDAKTLNGEMINISTEDGVMINDAVVLKTDIDASNGVVHVIDTVLIPSNI